ncbi:MAG: OB-fold nucleic acid binding domain-containing protein [Nanoarchaeota archaeon]
MTNIKDLLADRGNVSIEAEVISKEEARIFTKFGKEGRVCNVKIADPTGEISLVLWNEDIDKVKAGDTIKLENGWCSEFKGQKQVSSGKYGKLEVVSTKP